MHRILSKVITAIVLLVDIYLIQEHGTTAQNLKCSLGALLVFNLLTIGEDEYRNSHRIAVQIVFAVFLVLALLIAWENP